MSEIKNILINPFLNIFYLIRSLFWKRDESIVLMDAWFGEKFADNPRFLYQYLAENKESLKLTHVVWVTRNPEIKAELNSMGYESYLINSKESLYYHKHAKYHIVNNAPNDFDSFSGELLTGYSYGAKRINLWHGIAGKGVKFANREKIELYSTNKLFKLFLMLHTNRIWRLFFEQKSGWGDAFYLAQSSEGKKVLKSYFMLPDNNYIMTGYPRICGCPKLLIEEKRIVEVISQYESTILYLPTFRSNTTFDFKNVSLNLIDILENKNILWIQKAHSADSQNQLDSIQHKNIINLNPNFDINILLPYIDVLATDYSSCMLEGLGLKKKLIFYVPDFDEYIAKDRGLSYDPSIVMCGPKAHNISELRDIVSNIDSISTDTPQSKKAFELYWSETSEKGLAEIWRDIKKHIG